MARFFSPFWLQRKFCCFIAAGKLATLNAINSCKFLIIISFNLFLFLLNRYKNNSRKSSYFFACHPQREQQIEKAHVYKKCVPTSQQIAQDVENHFVYFSVSSFLFFFFLVLFDFGRTYVHL